MTPPKARDGDLKSLVIAMFVMLLFLPLAFLLASFTGSSSRVFGHVYPILDKNTPISFVDTSRDLFSLWKKKKVRGRVLVDLSRYFGFVEQGRVVDRDVLFSFPMHARYDLDAYEQNLTSKNVLWVGMQENIIRAVYHLVPEESFARIRSSALERQDPKVTISDREIILDYHGAKRVITSRVPRINEPVLVNVDASSFASGNSASLRHLRESGLSADVVTFCLSQDNPDVGDEERKRLRDAVAEVFP